MNGRWLKNSTSLSLCLARPLCLLHVIASLFVSANEITAKTFNSATTRMKKWKFKKQVFRETCFRRCRYGYGCALFIAAAASPNHLIILSFLLLPAPSHYTSQDASVWAELGCSSSSSSMFPLQVAEADRRLLLVLNRRVNVCPSLCVFSRWRQTTTSQSAAASMEAASDRSTWWYRSPSGRERSPVRSWLFWM